jgi:hypothetical protein
LVAPATAPIVTQSPVTTAIALTIAPLFSQATAPTVAPSIAPWISPTTQLYYISAYHCQFCIPEDTKLYQNNQNKRTITVIPVIEQ